MSKDATTDETVCYSTNDHYHRKKHALYYDEGRTARGLLFFKRSIPGAAHTRRMRDFNRTLNNAL